MNVLAGALLSADAVEQQFYEALQHGDLERLMALWSDDEEICCIHPGGERLVGAVAIRASFEAMFGNGPIVLQPESVRRTQRPGCAVHSVLERLYLATPAGRGASAALHTVWVVATNVYVETALGWRLLAHHASPGPANEPQPSPELPAVLH
jgi:uncharacterized protein (TIGR02246 family)